MEISVAVPTLELAGSTPMSIYGFKGYKGYTLPTLSETAEAPRRLPLSHDAVSISIPACMVALAPSLSLLVAPWLDSSRFKMEYQPSRLFHQLTNHRSPFLPSLLPSRPLLVS